MTVMANSEMPASAMSALMRYAEAVPFHVPGFAYPHLAGHADLFATPGSEWVVAPNMPQQYRQALSQRGIPWIEGTVEVGSDTATLGAYNVAVGDGLMIGNLERIDPEVRRRHKHQAVAVKQGMCRCAALILDRSHVITSDGGVAKALAASGVGCLLVESDPIQLPGYRSGCFGGCCGIRGKRLFLVGSLRHHPQGQAIRSYVAQTHIAEIVELYDGPLCDVGSLFFF